MTTLIPVILCGGTGSRLWPVSRELHPKPFIRLRDNLSLLQEAFIRAASRKDTSEALIVTNRDLYYKVDEELNEVNSRHLKTSYILEPAAKNTAAAISAAALFAAATVGLDVIFLVLPADHLIMDMAAFHVAIDSAVLFAKAGKLVTFGIQPTAPATGYGYIESEGNTVCRFIEKPPLEAAREYVSSGRYLWNSGIFCFTPRSLLREMELHCPDIVTPVRHCIQSSWKASLEELNPLYLSAEAFSHIPSESIDYAVMEKSANAAVIPCDIGWRDIGSWDALGDIYPSDSLKNCVEGSVSMQNTRSCYIRSHHRLVATIGINNLIVVDTPDALLVADKGSAQEVRHLYAKLKESNHDTYKMHRTVHRPWGTYTVLQEAPGFKVKQIEIKPGASLSLQLHQFRSEHWIVVQGKATVINGNESFCISKGQSTYIPAGNRHRLSNTEEDLLIIVEIQCGKYLGEDDIVRLEDIYGRA